MFFKKVLMPCGLCAAIPTIKPTNLSEENMSSYCNESGIKKLIRPSELPIYSFEDDIKQTSCTDCSPSVLEQNVSKIRKSVQAIASEYYHYTDIVTDTVNTSFEHSKSLVDYLREESNVMPRMGAIGIGGLTGLIFGLRGRTFKRLVYCSTGGLTMSALCYPKKAEEGFDLAKHYLNVGYNFIYGVKPGDDRQLEITMPKLPKLQIPTSFSEFVDLSIVTGSAVATVVGDFVRNTYTSLSGDKEKKQSMTELDPKTEINKQN